MAVVLAAAALALCPGWTVDALAQGRPPEIERLQALRALDRRVISVMHRLSVANRDQCPAQRFVAGWALHSAEQYSADLRPAARVQFGLSDGFPSVLALAAGGPAERAGVREDDVVLAVNGQSPAEATRADRAEASYAGLGRQVAAINRALDAGAPVLTIQRDGEERIVSLSPVKACGYEAQVLPSSEANGGADGARISITSTLAAYATNDDDLALLLAHEMAHNALGHAELWRSDRQRRDWLGLRRPSVVRQVEQQADRVGMIFAARAGYNLAGAAAFRRRMAKDFAAARYAWWGYPSGEERARAHDAVWQEILDLRRRGAPLIP